MSKKDKNFYVWTMAECIKDTYEQWGLDMMSMYNNIKRDFPNAATAIHKMYTNFENDTDCYDADSLTFEKPQYVYEAIANLIPNYTKLRFNLKTVSQSKEYLHLNVCSFNDFASLERIDLVMAVLLFTEEFILQPITSENVELSDTKLTVAGNFVNFEVLKLEDTTVVSIWIKDVILLRYVILN